MEKQVVPTTHKQQSAIFMLHRNSEAGHFYDNKNASIGFLFLENLIMTGVKFAKIKHNVYNKVMKSN